MSADAIESEVPHRCVVCGCKDLWRQKDFPTGLGLLIVGLAIVLSSVAIAWFRPVLALGILMGFALLDMLLFMLMKDRLVCYRCHARYRNTGALTDHGGFKLELNERYRQESLRLQSANQDLNPESTSRSPQING